ncbi:MAG: CDP-alcohol phosphatidyltransferase family protein [Rhodothermaceae bacterium]|nr:CDP-alcohol phosphatidyltransferase family protein [Rhodothermaceae bacterium]
MERVTYSTFNRFSRSVQSVYAGFVLDPLARLIAIPVINYTAMKPWHVTLISLISAIYSSWLFYQGQFVSAALVFQLSVVLDFVDGYVARIKKNGSVGGILFDGYNDIVRVMINVVALALFFSDNSTVLLLLLVFTSLHFAESFLDFEFLIIENVYRRTPPTSFTMAEKQAIRVKDWLEKFGLKTIFIHYQERLFFVLTLGPMLNQQVLATVLGIVAVLFSMHFKLILDTALIKNKIINRKEEYLRKNVAEA